MATLRFSTLWFVSIVTRLLVKQRAHALGLTIGISASNRHAQGAILTSAEKYGGVLAWLASFHQPSAGSFLAERQFCLPHWDIIITAPRNKQPDAPNIGVCCFLTIPVLA